jgi:biopolymer transport protein ExbD
MRRRGRYRRAGSLPIGVPNLDLPAAVCRLANVKIFPRLQPNSNHHTTMNPDGFDSEKNIPDLLKGKPRKPRIELVPLINLIFILFVAGALYVATMEIIQGLPAKIPVATYYLDDVPIEDILLLQASSDRGVYVDRELYDISEVSKIIEHYKQATEKRGGIPRVLITGDDRANYGLFVQLIDKVKGAGIKSYALETNYRPSGR